ncbi:GntR family transcriptional regulator [Phytohabitans flavus]|uniref:GntR family transcriptional regulator n=1 Tax=Phytohabitans flavus TaxID=1076124 RepID=A0A6F8XRY3_9ACTN|nr:GntR family transcriptional regulator [Phytohabitans flavus]BCB76595.1 GntR family transcriptional regulator [Phytohabitans flavus]
MTSTTGRVAQGSKAEVAYEVIRARILDGTFGPGYRLVLDRLAAEIGVSAVPVREALRRLEAEGYVDFKRNVGATVRSVDATAYGETMETLAILEATATSLAAPHLGKKEIKAARKLNESMARSLERLDPVGFSNLNQELHETLYRACPNTYLLGLVDREWERVRGIRSSSFAFIPERAQQAVAEHTRLIDLIENQSTPTKIEDYARAHRMRTAQRFLERHSATSQPVGGRR